MKLLCCLAIATFVAATAASSASASQLTSPAGTAYTSPVSAAQTEGHFLFETEIGPTTYAVECNGELEFQIEGHGLATTAAGLVRKIAFINCSNGTKFVVLQRGSLEFHALGNGNGTVTSSGLEVTFEDKLHGIDCKYRTSSSHFGTLTGSKNTGGTAIFDLAGATLNIVGFPGFGCGGPTFVVTSGSYVVNTPDYLDVS